MKSRNLIVGILALLMLFVAAARAAGIGSASPEHHPAHEMVHAGEMREATASVSAPASMPMDLGDGSSLAASTSDNDCHPVAQGCCPGAAAVLGTSGDALAPDNDGTRIDFTPTLSLASRIDGIDKPPWLDS